MDKDVKICFWCHNPLDGSKISDKEKYSFIVSSYEPCESCKNKYNSIFTMGVTNNPKDKNMPPILIDTNDIKQYPTGDYTYLDDETVKFIFSGNKELLEDVIKERKLYIPQDMLDILRQNNIGKR